MKNTGKMLREARESKGISLQEVSIHLKINTRILRALEDGDTSKLPAKTFLRGFVQSYSSYLRLDPVQVMDVFQLEMGTTHPGMITTDLTSLTNATEILPQNPAQISENKTSSSATTASATTNVNTQRRPSDPVQPQAPALSVDSKVWSRYVQIGIVLSALVILGLIVTVKRTIDKYEKEATIATIPENLETVKKDESIQISNTPATNIDNTNEKPEVVQSGVAETNSTITTSNNTPAATTNANPNSAVSPSAVPQHNVTPPPTAPTTTSANPTAKVPTTVSSTAATTAPTTTAVQTSPTSAATTTAGSTAKVPTQPSSQPATITKPTPAVTATATNAKPTLSAPITTPTNATATNTTAPKATPTNTPTSAVPTSVTAPTTAASTPAAATAQTTQIDSKQQTVIIEALDKVTIEYTIDGETKGSISLKPEGFHTFKAKNRIALVVSDGGSINLIHNGKDKGPPGNLGQPIKLNFP